MDFEMGGDGQSKIKAMNHMRVGVPAFNGAPAVWLRAMQPWVVKLDAASSESEVESSVPVSFPLILYFTHRIDSWD